MYYSQVDMCSPDLHLTKFYNVRCVYIIDANRVRSVNVFTFEYGYTEVYIFSTE